MGAFVNSLIAQGYGGYAGWDDGPAQADFNATGGQGKYTGGGGGSTGGYDVSSIMSMLGLGGGSGGGAASVNPNDANSIKAAYPGYAGWNDSAAIIADFRATGGAGKEGGGGGAGGAFNFDWEQAEKDALEKLRPYYEQKLSEAQGDVNLALSRIEEDYQQGRRYRTEDLAVEQEGWGMQEPRELSSLLEGLNRRGMLQSTIRTEDQQNLDDTQRRRREAVERGLRRREEVAGVERARGTEDINIKFPRFKAELEEEKKQRALELAGTKQQQGYQRYMAEAQRFIQ